MKECVQSCRARWWMLVVDVDADGVGGSPRNSADAGDITKSTFSLPSGSNPRSTGCVIDYKAQAADDTMVDTDKLQVVDDTKGGYGQKGSLHNIQESAREDDDFRGQSYLGLDF